MEACKNSKKGRYCGVPQCKSYDGNGISMHKIPKKVMETKSELKKWLTALKMEKDLPKKFVICSRHFKKDDLLIPNSCARRKVLLTNRAFPCENLPQSTIVRKKSVVASEKAKTKMQSNLQDLDPLGEPEMDLLEEASSVFDAVEVEVHQRSKNIQVNNEPEHLNGLPFRINTDRKLNTMTGIPTNQLLQSFVNLCLMIRTDESYNTGMSLRNRIVLTMFRLKTNMTNLQVANLFQLSEKDAKHYFSDCVQLLAKALKSCIYWPTQEENKENLPRCFETFANTMIVLYCTEIKTIIHRCLTCKTCTYSCYKGTHTVKILIGVSPSGLVNFLRTAVAERTSDKTVFDLTNLLENLKKGDAVMVGKGFLISSELSQAGVEVVRPTSVNVGITKEDVERDRLITAARFHVERRIARLKMFKILSEKISPSLIPYIDDICTIICAISNLNSPILDNDKLNFLIKEKLVR